MLFKYSLLAALAGSVAGHIHITEPAPLTSSENPNTSEGDTDYDINSPLSSMADYPCKGAIDLLGTPSGKSVQTYSPGQTYQMKMGTGADHNGGSCQISLSYDQGKTFKVIKSIIGGCAKQGGSWDFTIPDDAPNGEAVFSWSWNNNTGNREFYQNCAAVTIGGGSAKRDSASSVFARQGGFDSLPDIFVSNLGGEFCTPEGIDVEYPEPGNDVDNTTSSPGAAQYCDSGEEVPPGEGGGSPSPDPEPTSSPTPPQPTGGPPGDEPTAPPQPTPTMTTTTPSAPPTPAPTGGAGELSGACTEDGAWNCVSGTSYQRCASGVWSPVMEMAPGTTCTAGQSAQLKMAAGRRASPRDFRLNMPQV